MMRNYTVKIEDDENGEDGDGIIIFPDEFWDELGITPYDGMPVIWEIDEDRPGVAIMRFPDLENKFRKDLEDISD